LYLWEAGRRDVKGLRELARPDTHFLFVYLNFSKKIMSGVGVAAREEMGERELTSMIVP